MRALNILGYIATFDNLVAKRISREVITKYIVIKFSIMERGYMVTYKTLEDHKGNQDHMTPYNILSMKRLSNIINPH